MVRLRSLLTLVALVSCGGRSDRELTLNAGGATNGGGDAAGTDGGGAAGAGVTNSTGIDGLGCRGVPIPQEEYDRAASAACAGVDVACGLSPVHLHLVLERSTRMNVSIGGVSKWDLVRRALGLFLMPESSVSVSLRVFGASGGVDSARDCDPVSYAPALVSPVNGASARQAILDAGDALDPDGPAPVPAFEGTLAEVERLQRETSEAQRVVLILGGCE